MFNIKFKCESLTGETIHSVDIDDSSLGDTCDVFTIGEIPAYLKEVDTNCTHDLNVWFDENEAGKDELYLSLYPLLNDPTSDEQAPQTDTENPIRCKIVEVSGGDEKFINEGTEYFYYVDGTNNECCEDCGDEFPASELIGWRYEPDVKLCCSCTDDRDQEEDDG